MQALLTELSRPEYAALSHEQAAAALNAKTATVRRPVTTASVRQAAITGGYWAALVKARDVPQTETLAINVLAWIDDQSGLIQTVDMDSPPAVQMRAALVAAGIITQSQSDAMSALAEVTIPWTQSVNLPEVGIGLVINARRQLGA
jgi:hypothetical protein